MRTQLHTVRSAEGIDDSQHVQGVVWRAAIDFVTQTRNWIDDHGYSSAATRSTDVALRRGFIVYFCGGKFCACCSSGSAAIEAVAIALSRHNADTQQVSNLA